MRAAFLAAALLPALAATGCSLVPYGTEAQRAIETAVDTGIDDRRAYNDKKAEVLPVLACDISVGASSIPILRRAASKIRASGLRMP